MNRQFKPLDIKFFLLFGLLFLTINLFGQRQISGTLTDAETGEGLIGANVLIKDSGTGAVTDLDGNYSLSVPNNDAVLVFSYAGYQSQEIVVGTNEVIDIAMQAGTLLEEVVVIGYGTVKREDATGAVQSVNADQFNRGAITSAQELLAGKVPGVTIATDGGPGGGSVIRIRGLSSLSASNDPLIVIDGVPVDNGAVSGSRNILNILNPNDIESMSVLKDASASAIYGNRASGGVILITTKTGKVGQKLTVGYNGNISFGQAANKVDVLSADEYRSVMAERFDEGHPALDSLGSASTDWQDEIYQTAFGTDHNVYAQGAFKDLPYRFSLGYTHKQGLLLTDKFDRYTAGINLNPGFLDNTLQLNFSLKAMQNRNQFADRGAIGNALGFDPTQAIREEGSPYARFTAWTIPNGNPNLIAPVNPISLLELRDDNSTVNKYILSFSADYRLPFAPSLRANLNVASDRSKGKGSVTVPTTAAFAFDNINGGGVNNTYEQTKNNDLLEFYLNYKKEFGRNEVDLIGGYSWQHFAVDNSFVNTDANGTPAETTSGSDPSEYYLLSLFSRLNYSFNKKYLLTLSLRRDGTSRFAPENRWGLFPAVAGAVKIFENDKKLFNNLKVRAGWGVTGQQDIGDYYAYLSRYQIGTESASYQFGDEFLTTIRPNGYNAAIQWEETSATNIGVDFSIVKDRLGGSLDVYQNKTTDLLNRIPAPAGSNLSNFITTNIGNMESQGVELSLFSTPILKENTSLELAVNVGYNKNEITKLTALDDPTYEGILTGSVAGGVGTTIQIHSVGYAPNSFYVYEQMYDEDGNIVEGEFVDRNNDEVIDGLDRYRFEKPAADVTLGFTGKLELHNFDLSFAGRGSIGNYVYNNVQTDMGYLARLYHSSGSLWNVHQSAVDLNVEQQASLTQSDAFVKSANFLKFDHITLGYNFNDVLGKFFRIYFIAQNPLVFTKYDGLDPEIFSGIDNNIYPRPRTFVFGFNVEF